MLMASAPVYRRHRPYLGFRGAQVLAFVQETIAAEGSAPSYGMICDALGISTKGEVSQIVAALERRGLLRRTGHGRVRRIRLTIVKG